MLSAQCPFNTFVVLHFKHERLHHHQFFLRHNNWTSTHQYFQCYHQITSSLQCCGLPQNGRSQLRCSREVHFWQKRKHKEFPNWWKCQWGRVSMQDICWKGKKLNLRLLWNLRKFVHLSTTSVSSIMSADIKISCRQSFQIFYNENEKPERFLGKARRGRCIWSQPETEEFAGKFPADKKSLQAQSKVQRF